jgi:hypothetical protein
MTAPIFEKKSFPLSSQLASLEDPLEELLEELGELLKELLNELSELLNEFIIRRGVKKKWAEKY